MAAGSPVAATQRESAASGLRVLLEEKGATAGAGQGEPQESSRDPLPSSRPQPDGEASQVEEVDGAWSLPAEARQAEQGLEQGSAPGPRRPSRGPLPSCPTEDFSFIEVSEGELTVVSGLLEGSGYVGGGVRPHSQSFPGAVMGDRHRLRVPHGSSCG